MQLAFFGILIDWVLAQHDTRNFRGSVGVGDGASRRVRSGLTEVKLLL